jgi:hypothetical protein
MISFACSTQSKTKYAKTVPMTTSDIMARVDWMHVHVEDVRRSG